MILKIGFVGLVLLFLGLLLFITFYPLTLKNKPQSDADFHGMPIELDWSDDAPVHRIAIAVDFSVTDAKLIKKAVQQAHPSGFEHTPHQDTQFIFIHVVESVTANYLQDASDDAETRKDQERLDTYANALISKGYQVKTCLGYKNRVKEIVRIVNECDAQLLVMGGHRHQGWKDYIFGETIESVRHKVDIPVLIVNH